MVPFVNRASGAKFRIVCTIPCAGRKIVCQSSLTRILGKPKVPRKNLFLLFVQNNGRVEEIFPAGGVQGFDGRKTTASPSVQSVTFSQLSKVSFAKKLAARRVDV